MYNYILVSGNPTVLCERVNFHLKGGFELYGNPYSYPSGLHYQAMIKYTPKTNRYEK